jgi:hypothetical protein
LGTMRVSASMFMYPEGKRFLSMARYEMIRRMCQIRMNMGHSELICCNILSARDTIRQGPLKKGEVNPTIQTLTLLNLRL